ncbi:MAG: hypothetical protein RI911_461 [Candidatus Parcubacteria bacterium]|jgi:hypothetical protein
MKHHAQKVKELFDTKIVFNVVVGMLLTLFILKIFMMIGWGLGIGNHKGKGMYERGGRGGMMEQSR